MPTANTIVAAATCAHAGSGLANQCARWGLASRLNSRRLRRLTLGNEEAELRFGGLHAASCTRVDLSAASSAAQAAHTVTCACDCGALVGLALVVQIADERRVVPALKCLSHARFTICGARRPFFSQMPLVRTARP